MSGKYVLGPGRNHVVNDQSGGNKELLDDSVVIEPGAPFISGHDEPTEFFQLGYSSIPVDRIAEGIGVISKKIVIGQ